MAILSWRTPDGQTGEWHIESGPHRIGRAEGNDYTLPEPSVSSHHCEVNFDGSNLILRDLNSTNGTLIHNQRVQEALVTPGQNFRLGNVEFVFENTAASPASTAPPPPPISIARLAAAAHTPPSDSVAPDQSSSPAGGVCFHHPAAAAVQTCTKCGKDLCDECVKLELVGPKRVPFCRHCGGKCVPYGQPIFQQPQRRATFFEMLPQCFSYPFKGNGLILLITGTIFFGFIDLLTTSRAARFLLFLSFAILLVKVMMYGYMFAFMQKIVSCSAQGESEPPGWPEVSDIWQDIFIPAWLFFATGAVSFGPGILLSSQSALAGTVLIGLGMLYFPMALLAVAMSDSLAGLNPLLIVSAILKMPKAYLVAALVFSVLYVVRQVLPEFFTIPILSPFLIAFASLLLITIEMRILGVLYYTNREKFGWF